MSPMTYGHFNDAVRREDLHGVPDTIAVPPLEALANANHWEIPNSSLYAGVIKNC
jgi:hypothetical protein